MLEPDEWKRSRPVLRGEGGRKPSDLLGEYNAAPGTGPGIETADGASSHIPRVFIWIAGTVPQGIL